MLTKYRNLATGISHIPPKFEEFDPSELKMASLSCRKHDLDISSIRKPVPVEIKEEVFHAVAEYIIHARSHNASVVFMMGAHVLRSGMQRYVIDLMSKGCISCIATNGAGAIHDFEFALIGATTESVSRYIKDGRFGLWSDTSSLNEIITDASKRQMGLGESVGKAILEGDYPNKNQSVFAAAYQMNIPVTVHVGIGYDIVHEHPNCSGAAYGDTSYRDFLRFAAILNRLENGVVMNFGSAVMAPEIFLKALAMVRNTARQERREISRFATLVCDIVNLPKDYHKEPDRDNPLYYFRPWKTMLVRSVNQSGTSFYVRGRHDETIPQLWTAIEEKLS